MRIMREFMIINLRIYHQKCKLLICFEERREEGGGQDKEQSWPSYGGNKLIVSERRERDRERETLHNKIDFRTKVLQAEPFMNGNSNKSMIFPSK